MKQNPLKRSGTNRTLNNISLRDINTLTNFSVSPSANTNLSSSFYYGARPSPKAEEKQFFLDAINETLKSWFWETDSTKAYLRNISTFSTLGIVVLLYRIAAAAITSGFLIEALIHKREAFFLLYSNWISILMYCYYLYTSAIHISALVYPVLTSYFEDEYDYSIYKVRRLKKIARKLLRTAIGLHEFAFGFLYMNSLTISVIFWAFEFNVKDYRLSIYYYQHVAAYFVLLGELLLSTCCNTAITGTFATEADKKVEAKYVSSFGGLRVYIAGVLGQVALGSIYGGLVYMRALIAHKWSYSFFSDPYKLMGVVAVCLVLIPLLFVVTKLMEFLRDLVWNRIHFAIWKNGGGSYHDRISLRRLSVDELVTPQQSSFIFPPPSPTATSSPRTRFTYPSPLKLKN